MTTLKMLFPIRAMIPCDVPQADDTLRPNAVLTWPDGGRQLVSVVYEDRLLGEAYVRCWERAGTQAVVIERFAELGWIEGR